MKKVMHLFLPCLFGVCVQKTQYLTLCAFSIYDFILLLVTGFAACAVFESAKTEKTSKTITCWFGNNISN